MPAVVFDANGTLFTLEPVQELLGEAAAEAFFQRTLHSAVWVDRDERQWPLAGVEPGEEAPSLLAAVQRL